MQTVRAVVSTAIRDSARVQLVGGMFDLGVPARAERTFETEVPDLKEAWRIGCIVGPSGSGKSTLARAAFGKALWIDPTWPAGRAIVDCFGDIEVRKVTSMLTAVGFSSPPAWIRPFSTLSNGEQFRANLARALIGSKDLLVYDEFTSLWIAPSPRSAPPPSPRASARGSSPRVSSPSPATMTCCPGSNRTGCSTRRT